MDIKLISPVEQIKKELIEKCALIKIAICIRKRFVRGRLKLPIRAAIYFKTNSPKLSYILTSKVEV
jgi:hypothetical protein